MAHVPTEVNAGTGSRSSCGAADPLFILSCHRSGSTLLRFALDTHPAIYCPPELFLGNAAFSLVTLLSGLNAKIFEKEEAVSPQFSGILTQTRQIITDQMSLHAARRGKRLWCEKTPDNMEYLDLIHVLFPQAKYLCLYRHCLDVVKSALEISDKIPALLPFLYASRGQLMTALIRYWTEWNGRLLRFEAAHPERCHRIYYEALVSDPVPSFTGLFSFLELDWDERLIDSIFSSEHDPGVEDFKVRSRNKIHQDSLGSGRDLSLGGVPEKTLAAMRQLLEDLDYPPTPQRHTGPRVGEQREEKRELGAPPGVAWLFENHLSALFKAEPQLAGWIGSSYQFVIKGEGGGQWGVDIRDGKARVFAGTLPAACTINISSSDLTEIVGGRLVPLAALRDGRLRIEGAAKGESLLRLLELFSRGRTS